MSQALDLPTHRAGTRHTRTPLWAAGLALLLVAVSSKSAGRPSEPTPRPVSSHGHTDHSGEPGRGRQASHPGEIPARGWKDIALRIYHGITEDRIMAISAGVVFFVLLAIFPGIAGLISLYGLYADPTTIAQHLELMGGVVPAGGLEIIREQVDRLAAQPSQRLGLALGVSLAISLWSANGGMKALFDALNVVYHEREKRSFIALNAVSLTFTLGTLFFVLLAIAAITVLPAVLNFVGLPRGTELLLRLGRWPVLLLIASFAIALLYRYGPSRDKAQWRWISPGSALAAIAWLAVSLAFSWYAENFGSFNKTYGSLGAAIGFMMWMWVSTIVVLIGAKLNAEIEHQTARDTTEGHPRPLGARGATMADTLGEAHAAGS